MKHIRQDRLALAPLSREIGRPSIHTWTGNKAFKRIRGKRYSGLVARIDDDKLRAFLSAIGWVEVNWAILEQNLDHWSQLIFRNLGGNSLESRVPLNFSAKCGFLRKSFDSIPALENFKLAGLDILGRAEGLAITRHDLTHAAMVSVEPNADGIFELVNRKLNRDGSHTTKDVKFDPRTFPNLSLKFVKLGRDSIQLSYELASAFLGLEESREN